MTLPDPAFEINSRMNELLDQLGCGLERAVGTTLVKKADDESKQFVMLDVHAAIDVQAFLTLWQPPPGTPYTTEGG